jgi:hypothetical protein
MNKIGRTGFREGEEGNLRKLASVFEGAQKTTPVLTSIRNADMDYEVGAPQGGQFQHTSLRHLIYKLLQKNQFLLTSRNSLSN